MSYTDHVRTEMLQKALSTAESRAATAYGCLLFFRSQTTDCFTLETRSKKKAEGIVSLLNSVYPDRVTQAEKSKGRLPVYEVSLKEIPACLASYGYPAGALPEYINLKLLKTPERKAAFLAGVFLSCGSINQPEKTAHLEFIPPSEALVTALGDLLERAGLPFRRSVRQKTAFLYVKEGNKITDFLTACGATACALEFMEAQVEKSLKNQINRRNNCDTANIGKTMSASLRQSEQIRILMDSEALFDLPEELQQIALLRLANPELSLSELGKLTKPPLSRSGVNHRLEKIARWAEKDNV